MISSFKEFEYMFDNFGFLVISFVILKIIGWIINIISPYYLRKSKLEKLDEYKDKYKELNGYHEKTHVIDKIMEEEYGRILLNERDISKQKIMIFLLNYNLCRTIKEAKKFTIYLVFRESQKSLVFNMSFSLFRFFFILILLIIFFSLFVYFRFKAQQTYTDFEAYTSLTLCILSYVLCIVLSFIFSGVLADLISTRKLIKKNPKTIQKISSRLSELNSQENLKIERKNLKEKSTIEQTKKARRKKLKHANAN